MLAKKLLTYIFLISLISCTSNIITIEEEVVKITLIGDVVPGDWLEANDYRIEFILPDKSLAIPQNPEYNPYVLTTSIDKPKTAFVAPSSTYKVGPGKPILMPVAKGIVLNNIAKMLAQLSYNEYKSVTFNFKSDQVTHLQGLIIVGMKSGEDIKISHPQSMKILVEPYTRNN